MMKKFAPSKFFLGFLAGVFSTLLVMLAWTIFTFLSNFSLDVGHTPIEPYLGHFYTGGKTKVPAGSSYHYFFRDGFGDTVEFWSFNLPPDKMESFVSDYVAKNHISRITDKDKLSTLSTYSLAVGKAEPHGNWRPEYWFSSLKDLDKIYCSENDRRGDFATYSKEKGRVYLMNCNF